MNSLDLISRSAEPRLSVCIKHPVQGHNQQLESSFEPSLDFAESKERSAQQLSGQ